MHRTLATAFGLAACVGIAIAPHLSTGAVAKAAEIKVMSAYVLQPILEDLGPKFEQASGHKLTITYATSGGAVTRVQNGDSADVVIIPRQGIDSIVTRGKAMAADVTAFAHAGIGVAVRKGAPKPDISSSEAFKRALLAAKSIAYSDPALGGVSSIHFAKVLERLGIADEMKAKTLIAKPGDETAVWVANGRAEIGVHYFQVLVSVPGIEIVGPLPDELQDVAVFSAAIMAGTHEADAVRTLVNFLHTPEVAAVIKAKGMEPE
jgi:molybdate transport system substrate-binding protein